LHLDGLNIPSLRRNIEMKIFRCDHCGHPVFFENVQCLHCGSTLAFIPEELTMASMVSASSLSSSELLRQHPENGMSATYRMCVNHSRYRACNFAVAALDGNALCVSCRQTRVVPDLSISANEKRWYLIEAAKRRLFYTLARLGLVLTDGLSEPDQGPHYEFLGNIPGTPPVMTGHNQGLITLNIAEADDDERARRRLALGEPYRTLLGHLRHESGHYYWDRLILAAGRVDAFRAVFGDESLDYPQALRYHYAADHHSVQWRDSFVSSYATAHPWEDWAETWAHYLHMVDLLETAAAFHTALVVPGGAAIAGDGVHNPFDSKVTDFDQLVSQWIPVTLMLNSMNRSLGQNDAYPFALSEGALHKLRFVHHAIHSSVNKPVIDDLRDMSQPAHSQ
jgi:hypothetical protein